jgi:hypothetical protein
MSKGQRTCSVSMARGGPRINRSHFVSRANIEVIDPVQIPCSAARELHSTSQHLPEVFSYIVEVTHRTCLGRHPDEAKGSHGNEIKNIVDGMLQSIDRNMMLTSEPECAVRIIRMIQKNDTE